MVVITLEAWFKEQDEKRKAFFPIVEKAYEGIARVILQPPDYPVIERKIGPDGEPFAEYAYGLIWETEFLKGRKGISLWGPKPTFANKPSRGMGPVIHLDRNNIVLYAD